MRKWVGEIQQWVDLPPQALFGHASRENLRRLIIEDYAFMARAAGLRANLVNDPDRVGFPDLVLFRERPFGTMYRTVLMQRQAPNERRREWIDLLVDADEDVMIWRPLDRARVLVQMGLPSDFRRVWA